ncbi:MAG: hypothetical protein NWR47_03415, partial [Aestuariivirgaceae bacterium]|nr:hypothetical protein [Aestuariivirgaceae bacterium]
ASVCRETGINRQQFNRYLAGTAIPSAQVMRSICAKFGVAEASMFLPNAELSRLVGMGAAADELVRLLGTAGARKPDQLKPGYYFHYEPVADGTGQQLLRSLYHVRESQGSLIYRARRRARQIGKPEVDLTRHRSSGTILRVAGHLYFFELRQVPADELSFAVFGSAGEKSRLRNGLVFREKRAMRSVLEYMGEHVAIRTLLARCGYFTADDIGVDESLRAMLLPANEAVAVLEA